MRKGIWLVLMGLLPVCALAVGWQYECIADYDKYYYKRMWHIDMDYDAAGDDHIAWIDTDGPEPGPRYIYYTYLRNPRSGDPPTAFTELVAVSKETGVAIAVDRNADPPVPYILYTDDESPVNLRLASRVNGAWTYEIVRTFPFFEEPYEMGDEINHAIEGSGLAVGDDGSIHAAYTVWTVLFINKKDNDYPRDVAYATRTPSGPWELTNWLGTRESWPPPSWKERKRYQQTSADILLDHNNEPYISFCEHEYSGDQYPSYIFVATPDGAGGWDYDQVLEMDNSGAKWAYTYITSLGDRSEVGAEPALHLAFISTGISPYDTIPARTYYVFRDDFGQWHKDTVYEYPYYAPVMDVEVLSGDYGPGVAFGEYTFTGSEPHSYAALFAQDPSGDWLNIMPVDKTRYSGVGITAAVKPDGYTDVFYNWGYTSLSNGGGEDTILGGAFELPGLDFASGPPADVSRVPVLTRAFAAPNPVAQTLHIKFELSCPGVVKMAAYDLAGRKIHTEACAGVAGVNTLSVPVSHWPRGVYIYELSTSDSCKTGKAVVAR
jgi:hypothetical protein